MKLLIRINGVPKGKGRPRFTKSGRTYTPSETKAYEQEIKSAALKAAMIQQWLKPDAGTPLLVTLTAYFLAPKSWSKKKREQAKAWDLYPTVKPDLDNIAKAVLDALNGIAYHDDKDVVSLQVNKRFCFYEDDADNQPHLTVQIEQMKPFSQLKAEAVGV